MIKHILKHIILINQINRMPQIQNHLMIKQVLNQVEKVVAKKVEMKAIIIKVIKVIRVIIY